MPIYEYKCDACEHEMEALQKMSDEPLVVCPQCNKNALVKKISAAGFRLKGGGWYETDFKSGKRKTSLAIVVAQASHPTNNRQLYFPLAHSVPLEYIQFTSRKWQCAVFTVA